MAHPLHMDKDFEVHGVPPLELHIPPKVRGEFLDAWIGIWLRIGSG